MIYFLIQEFQRHASRYPVGIAPLSQHFQELLPLEFSNQVRPGNTVRVHVVRQKGQAERKFMALVKLKTALQLVIL